MSNPAWHDSSKFYFNAIVEANFESIRGEALDLLGSGKFYPHDQSATSTGGADLQKLAPEWNVHQLHRRCQVIPNLAPFTTDLLTSFPEIRDCEVGLIYFSQIPAGGVVAPHRSMFAVNARIRHQLCLELPELGPNDEVYLEANGERRTWTLGKVFTFDDAYDHHVKNISKSARVVLLYDSNPL